MSSIQIGPQPARRGFQVDTAPPRIIFQLVAADPRDAKILAFGVAEVKAADRRGRQHGKILGQHQPGIFARRE